MDLLMNLIQLHLIVVMVLVYHNLIMFLSIDLSQVNIGPERLIVRPPNHMADLVYLSLSCKKCYRLIESPHMKVFTRKRSMLNCHDQSE